MLPPYARAIVDERNAGRHPAGIVVALSDEWQKVTHALYPGVLALEADYLAGKYEWWFCAGVPLFVLAGGRQAATWLALAGELGEVTAPVTVYHSIYCPRGLGVDELMSNIARRKLLEWATWLEFADHNWPWPQFWTWARHETYQAHYRAELAERIPLGRREPDRAMGTS